MSETFFLMAEFSDSGLFIRKYKMRDILYFKNRDGQNFKMGEISLKYRAFGKTNFGKLAELRIYHPKSNPVDESNGDTFYFRKMDGDYYLVPNLGFAAIDGPMLLFNAYHPLLLLGEKVRISEFIQTVYRDYFFCNGRP